MSALKNGVLLRNRKAENRPLMKVMCFLHLFTLCLPVLLINIHFISIAIDLYNFASVKIRSKLICLFRQNTFVLRNTILRNFYFFHNIKDFHHYVFLTNPHNQKSLVLPYLLQILCPKVL